MMIELAHAAERFCVGMGRLKTRDLTSRDLF